MAGKKAFVVVDLREIFLLFPPFVGNSPLRMEVTPVHKNMLH